MGYRFVLRAVAESGRAAEFPLYTGNDDAIVAHLTDDDFVHENRDRWLA
jgi:hypothetical protein